jgi:hypothetical protein
MLARLFRDLEAYHPTLVGSFPLGLQIDGSDLDIVCDCEDLEVFERALGPILAALGVAARVERYPEFAAVVAVFEVGDVEVEIFAQALPVHAQRGFRHLVIEGRLLGIGGAALRTQVRELKRAGLKTEPAFARILGLAGDPHQALLELESWSPERLAALIRGALATSSASIAIHEGDRAALVPLFRLADDSDQEIDRYLGRGVVLAAVDAGVLVGHVQMLATDQAAT